MNVTVFKSRILLEMANPFRLVTCAALLLILGAKLTLIGTVANPVPYWDQWFGEGENLFLPYLEHGIRGPALFSAHNEHRILFSRLLGLGVLEICGSWNTIAEMLAGALLHICALGSLIYLLRRVISSSPLLPIGILVLVFAIPFGGENTLWGFESGNYIIIFLGTWCVALTATNEAFNKAWWVGYTLGVLGIFAMAAAGTAPAATGLLASVQIFLGVRNRSGREIGGALLLIATGAVMLAITPHPPGYLGGRPSSLGSFAWSFGLAGGWPITLPLIGPILLNIPAFCLGRELWRRRISFDHFAWRIVAFAGWVGLQAAGIAYTRATGPIASRYLDALSIGCVVNAFAFVALRRLASENRSTWSLFAAAWLGGVAACLVFQAVYFLPRAYFLDPRIKAAQISNITSYMTTRQFGHLGLAPYSLTFDEPKSVARVIDQPLIRGLLPAELGSTVGERETTQKHLLLKGGIRLGWKKTGQAAKLVGIALLFLGVWLFVFLAFARTTMIKRKRRRSLAENMPAPALANMTSR